MESCELLTSLTSNIRPNFLNLYPRIMGNPVGRDYVHNSEERKSYIQEYYGFRNIYISVYAFSKIMPSIYQTHQHAVVDRFFIDIDPKIELPSKKIIDVSGNWITQEQWKLVDVYPMMMKIHKRLLDLGAMHLIDLSGKGFHVFGWIVRNLKYPKLALANFWDYMYGNKTVNKTNYYVNPFKDPDFKYEPLGYEICPSTRGDVGRIFRHPNTKNWSADCYCIQLDDNILEHAHSLKEIQSIAKNPYIPKGNVVFGDKLLDLSFFDCNKEYIEEHPMTELHLGQMDYSNIKIDESVDFDIEDTPPCIQELVKYPMHFEERNAFIKFLASRTDTDFPYSVAQILGILKQLSYDEPWLRWFFTTNNIDILYRNVRIVHDNDSVQASCKAMDRLGMCNKALCNWSNIRMK